MLAGIAAAAARFVPVPFVDDMIRTRSTQFAVARTLAAHDYDYSSKDLAPLFDGDSGGFLSGMLRKVVRAPFKLLFYPVRKLIRIFGSVRGVPLDLMRTILTARTLDRCIRRGMFDPAKTDAQTRTEQAQKVRLAFEEAFEGIDWITVRAVMSDTMIQVKHWGGVTTDLARQAFGRDDQDPDRLTADDLADNDDVKQGAAKVEAMLAKPETLQLIGDFDQRVDAALGASST